jgi:hypothetical protein
MTRRLDVFARRSGLGAIPVAFGGVWKGFEFVHTAGYVKDIVLKLSHSDTLANIASSQLSPYVLIVSGCAWALYFEVRHKRTAKAKVDGSAVLFATAPVSILSPSTAVPPSLTKVVAEARSIVPDANEFVVRQTTTEIIIRARPEDPAA